MSKVATYPLIAVAALVLAVIAAGLAVCPLVLSSVFAGSQPAERDVIDVMGEAVATVKPDLVIVTLAVEEERSSAEEAMKAQASKMSKVIDTIKGLGIVERDITTTGLRLYPVYVYEDGKQPRLVAYRALNQIMVKTSNLDVTGRLVDTAIASGVNRISDISFTLSREEGIELERETVDRAVQNARKKAESIARSIGAKLGRATRITEGVSYPVPRPMPYAEKFGVPTPTPIQPGELELTVQVQATFEIEY